MMPYHIKEIFYTLQGEGANSGRPAVFCRFSGCNLWSGREEDRPSSLCRFCDTDFLGTNGRNGGEYESAEELAGTITALFPGSARPFVVCTGGEPLLQLDERLIDALKVLGAEIAVETNGTVAPPVGIDWLTVSPKAGTRLRATTGGELKVTYPQAALDPARFECYRFKYYYLQPMDGPLLKENTRQAINYCLKHPLWRLSIQSHKVLGIP